MKLGMKLIVCWMIAVAFGGAATGAMFAANNADISSYELVSAN